MPLLTSLRWLAMLLSGSCLTIPASQQVAPGAEGSLVIRRGGTYTGVYHSTNPAVPCIRIDTSEPVTLYKCTLSGPGNLIEAKNGGAQLIIRECVGTGLLPAAYDAPRGRFLEVNSARSVRLENNAINHTRGILIYQWAGDGSARQTLKVLRNVVRNVDGRFRNGQGTFATFIGLNGARNLAGAEIAWNEVINEPNNSLVEDNINFYNSSGTADSPIRVHDNYIYGAFPAPADAAKYTGSGITTDGDGNSDLTTTAYIEAYRNQLVATCAALNIAAGHHNYFHDNRVVTSRHLPNGQHLTAGYAAVAIWNAYDKPPTVFHDNRFDRNTIGFVKPGMQQPYADRHDVNFEACTPCTNTTHLPNPITMQTEQQEWTRWRQKLRQQQVQVGPTTGRHPAPAIWPTAALAI